mmetsp:Transcript_6383/g.13378  ORF Transcript_6383/g.13378 Transcript_6383/m.13378 type:complete len:84 (+) Transcript_6383:513-764(+)
MSSFMSKNTFQITLYIQYSDKYILLPTGKLTKKVEDLDSLHFMMEVQLSFMVQTNMIWETSVLDINEGVWFVLDSGYLQLLGP